MSTPRPLQVYEGDEVTVTFDRRLCIHSEQCVHRLPAVFDPTRKRWIRPDAAAATEVMAAVGACPSGALRARRRADPETAAALGEAVTVTVSKDGPLLLRGRLRILNAAGETIATADAAALCRCGATANAPYCDGSHAGRATPLP